MCTSIRTSDYLPHRQCGCVWIFIRAHVRMLYTHVWDGAPGSMAGFLYVPYYNIAERHLRSDEYLLCMLPLLTRYVFIMGRGSTRLCLPPGLLAPYHSPISGWFADRRLLRSSCRCDLFTGTFVCHPCDFLIVPCLVVAAAMLEGAHARNLQIRTTPVDVINRFNFFGSNLLANFCVWE